MGVIIIESNDKISIFKILNEYKIGEQVWCILYSGETLIITKKEHCMPLYDPIIIKRGEYSYMYSQDDKYETMDTVNFNMLMIQKQIVTISKA